MTLADTLGMTKEQQIDNCWQAFRPQRNPKADSARMWNEEFPSLESATKKGRAAYVRFVMHECVAEHTAELKAAERALTVKIRKLTQLAAASEYLPTINATTGLLADIADELDWVDASMDGNRAPSSALQS